MSINKREPARIALTHLLHVNPLPVVLVLKENCSLQSPHFQKFFWAPQRICRVYSSLGCMSDRTTDCRPTPEKVRWKTPKNLIKIWYIAGHRNVHMHAKNTGLREASVDSDRQTNVIPTQRCLTFVVYPLEVTATSHTRGKEE